MLAMRANETKRTAELTTASALFIHGTPIDVLGFNDQRTLTGSADVSTDDTPETPTALLTVRRQYTIRNSTVEQTRAG